jgi:hypothetical protein
MTVPEENDVRRPSRWPADYYSSPTPNAVLPSWLTLGCGIAGALALLLIFAGGYFASRGGMTQFMDFAIGMSITEMRGQYTPDVSAARKKSLDDEIARLRQNYREGKVALPAIQPFLEAIRDVSADGKVTGPEAARLEESTRKINAGAKR